MCDRIGMYPTCAGLYTDCNHQILTCVYTGSDTWTLQAAPLLCEGMSHQRDSPWATYMCMLCSLHKLEQLVWLLLVTAPKHLLLDLLSTYSAQFTLLTPCVGMLHTQLYIQYSC